jgi:hypothetical protein
MLLAYSGNLDRENKSPFEYASKIFEEANRHAPAGVSWEKPKEGEE